MKCSVLLLFLACACTSVPTLAADWPDAEKALGAYHPFVYVAEEPENYGGLCVRLINADAQGVKGTADLVTALKAAQGDLKIHELHVMHFPERKFDDMSFVSAVPDLRLLSLGGSNFERKEIGKLSALEKLTQLYISGDGWDQAALEALGTVKTVRGLRAQCLRADWKHFPTLPNLEELDLGNSDFNSAGVQSLQGCSKLSRLHLYQTKIDDEGFLALAKIESLTFIGVTPPGKDGATVSAEAVETFRKLRPDIQLKIVRPKTPHPPGAPKQPRRPAGGGSLAQR